MSNEYFLGKGAGDLYIKAECVFVSKTYEVHDWIKYDPTEHNYTTIQQDMYPYAPQTFTLPSHFKFGFKLMNKTNYSGNNVLRLFLHPSSDTASLQPNNGFWLQVDSATKANGGTRNNGATELNTSNVPISINTWVDMEMEVNGTTVIFRINGTDVGTVTKTWITNYTDWVIRLMFTASTVNATYKDLKIIPL